MTGIACDLPTSVGIAVIVVVIGRLVFVFRLDQVGGVEKGALFGTDVDKGGLKSRQDRIDFPEVNIADHPTGFGTVDEELNELVVLEDGDPRLARGRVDQNLSFHRGSRPQDQSATRQPQRDMAKDGWPGLVAQRVDGPKLEATSWRAA